MNRLERLREAPDAAWTVPPPGLPVRIAAAAARDPGRVWLPFAEAADTTAYRRVFEFPGDRSL